MSANGNSKNMKVTTKHEFLGGKSQRKSSTKLFELFCDKSMAYYSVDNQHVNVASLKHIQTYNNPISKDLLTIVCGK